MHKYKVIGALKEVKEDCFEIIVEAPDEKEAVRIVSNMDEEDITTDGCPYSNVEIDIDEVIEQE